MSDNPRKFCLIHCHLFKNGGTTLDWAFKRHFGKAFLDHRDDEKMRKGADYLASFIQENPYLKVISSHHVRLPLPELPDLDILPLFMIRHPLDRVESVYKFERKQRADTPGARMAKELDLADYILWRMKPDIGGTLRDFQCRFCSGQITRNNVKMTDKDGGLAVTALQNTPFTGVVDRFDESIVLFEYQLAAYEPDIDLAYIAQNVNRERVSNPERRGEELLEKLPAQAGEILLENNRQDLELYRQANHLLDRRLAEISDFDSRLAGFRERCRNLRKTTWPWLRK